jgi:hypothetical protein
MARLLLPTFLLALALSACKKDDPAASLPAPTQDGRNTAGCFIDGHAFVAAAYGGGTLSAPLPALSGGFAFDSSYHLIMRGQVNGEGVEVMLFLQGRKPRMYVLNRTTPYYPQATPRQVLSHATYRLASSQEVYVTTAHHTGEVVLTTATSAQRPSAGTFSFTAVSTRDSTKTVTITSGRFDRGVH